MKYSNRAVKHNSDIKIRVPENMKSKFYEVCKAEKVVPSKVLRNMIEGKIRQYSRKINEG